ncbi:Testis-specific Y-encoded-like protein 1 [Rhynchospora pubera]|uniref:Testis-specific Y-encoded-like protein 1 n=1 Tax=Rhynchospora pubera TaxID=906938 RepID=A0AAV8HRK2_9POAL|nr:Testis-specific Y-encoded-like protein 1 [Rhynchospora pubera]
MAAADKGKKAKVAEEGGSPSPWPSTASPELLQSFSKLQEIQDQLEKINVKASDEVLVLVQNFNVLRKPILVRRNEVIGTIREFWSTALITHPILGDLFSEEDKKILQHMSSLEVEEAKDVKSGYSIIFNFSPNPYFEDEKLIKTYCFNEEGKLSIMCQPIKWKDGKGTTDGNVHDKGGKRPYTSECFFTWFSETVKRDGRVDQIAEIIRDDLWSNPLRHFQEEVDAMDLYGEAEGEGDKGSGGGNEGAEEDEDGDDEEVEDDDNKEYNEKDGDGEEEDIGEDEDDGDTDADTDEDE